MFSSWEVIRNYVGATFAYWWLLLPGALMAAPEIYRWFHPKSKELRVPRSIRWGLGIICLVVAQFLAYRDSQLNLASVIADKQNQSIHINSLNLKIQEQEQKIARFEVQISDLSKVERAGARRSASGFVQVHDIVPLPEESIIGVGRPLAMNLYFLNSGTQPVYDVFAYGKLTIKESVARLRDELKLLEDFKNERKKEYRAKLRAGRRGNELGIGQGSWNTYTLPALNEKQVAQLLNGSSRIYVYGWATWKDSEGYSGSTETCRWLQAPTSTQLKAKELAWHICSQ